MEFLEGSICALRLGKNYCNCWQEICKHRWARVNSVNSTDHIKSQNMLELMNLIGFDQTIHSKTVTKANPTINKMRVNSRKNNPNSIITFVKGSGTNRLKQNVVVNSLHLSSRETATLLESPEWLGISLLIH